MKLFHNVQLESKYTYTGRSGPWVAMRVHYGTWGHHDQPSISYWFILVLNGVRYFYLSSRPTWTPSKTVAHTKPPFAFRSLRVFVLLIVHIFSRVCSDIAVLQWIDVGFHCLACNIYRSSPHHAPSHLQTVCEHAVFSCAGTTQTNKNHRA